MAVPHSPAILRVVATLVTGRMPGNIGALIPALVALDPGLEARLEEDGSVGVYGLPQALVRDVQVADQKSRALLDEARAASRKSARLFVLPAPVLRDARGLETRHGLRFELHGTRLRLVATGLADLAYPVSLDPTILVTLTADFALGGANETGVDIAADQITNQPPAIGVGAWASTTAISPYIKWGHASVAYNGYLYLIGGIEYISFTQKYSSRILAAPLQAVGQVGAWTTAGSIPEPVTPGTGRDGLTAVAYNGYLYVIGGHNYTSQNNYWAEVFVAPINADGTLGAWVTTTSLPTGRSGHASFVYNGFLYVLGGQGSAGLLADVQMAPIKGDGTLGAWTAQASLPTARSGHAVVVSNGSVYVIGGSVFGGVMLSDVLMAPLSTLGTLVGPWGTTTPLPGVRSGHMAVLSNGAIFVMGGSVTAAVSNDVLVASVAGGTPSAWTATTSLPFSTQPRLLNAAAVANGYIYVSGGQTYADVISAPLTLGSTGAAQGRYSRLIDLKADSTIDSITLHGLVQPGGVVQLTMRTASSAAPTFGGASTAWSVSMGTPITLTGVTGVRYLWLEVYFDDSAVAGTARSNVTDLSVAYRAGLGLACGVGTDCASGFCADAVCCNSACGGSCDVCNAATTTGTCTLAAPNTPGAPACAPYLCSGALATCPTTCGGYNLCVDSTWSCVTSACVANTLSFATAPQTFARNACAGPFTVTSSAPGLANPTVTVASSAGANGRFYTDAACTIQFGNATLQSGTSSLNFFYKDTTSGASAPTLTVTGVSGYAAPATQTQTVTAFGAPAKLVWVVGPPPNGNVAGTPIAPALVVQVQDAAGNVVANSSAAVTLSTISNTTVWGTPTVNALNGVATFPAVSLQLAGSGYQLRASSPGLPDVVYAAPFSVSPAAPASLNFAQQPISLAAGAQMSVTVTAWDAYGNACNTTGGTVTLSFGTNAGGALATLSASPATFNNGVASFAGVIINKTGNGYTLKATSSGGLTTTSVAFNVTPGALAALSFLQPPLDTVAGSAIAPPVQVAFVDAYANVATQVAGAITLAQAPNGFGATLGGTKTVTVVNGVATFSTLTLDRTGVGYQLVASAAGVPALTSTPFAITPGAAFGLAITTQPPASNTAGAAIPVGVTVVDALGNAVPTANNQVTLTSTPPGAATTLSSAPTAGAVLLSPFITAAGTGYTFTATSPTLASATTNPLAVVPATPTHVAFTTDTTNVAAGVAMSPAVAVTEYDAYNNVATNSSAPVTLAFLNDVGGTGSTLAGAGPMAPTAGVATFSALKLSRPGVGYTLKALCGGLPAPSSASFTVVPGAPVKLLVQQQPPGSSVAGTPFTVKVALLDSNDNVATQSTASVTFALDANAVTGSALGGTRTVSAVNGVATFSTLWLNKVGTAFTLTATSAGTVSATTTPVDITVAGASNLAVVAQPPAVNFAGATIPFTVGLTDPYGNVATTPSFIATFQANPIGLSATGFDGISNGLDQANLAPIISKAGTGYSFLVTSTPAFAPVTTATFSVIASTAAGLVFTVPPSNRTAGTAMAPALQVALADAYGNPRNSGSGNTIALSLTTGTGTLSGGGPATIGASVPGAAVFPAVSIDLSGVGKKLTATTTQGGSTWTTVSPAFDITGAAPASLYFTSAPASVQAGTCSAVVNLGLRDVFGNVTAATSPVSVSLSAPGLTFYSDATCTTSVTSTTFGSTQSTAGFYFKGALTATPTITATSAAPSSTATINESIVAANATKLAITTAPVTATAGACSGGLTVQAQDVNGNPNVVSSPTSVTLSGGSSVAFFTDAICSTPASGLQLTGANSAPSVYFKSTLAQTFTLTVAALPLTGTSQAGQAVVAASATRLVFTDAAPTVVAGACSPVRTVTATDAFGNPATPSATVNVALASNSGGTFFSDAACTTPVTTRTLAGAGNTATFYARHTVAGSPTVTVTDLALGLTAATESPTITAAAPARLQFVTQPQATVAGLALGGPPQVAVEDAFGNRITGSTATVTVALANNAGGGTLSGTSGVAAVTGLANFPGLSLNKAGAGYTLGATSVGLTPATSAAFDITPAAVSRLAFTTPPSNVAAGAAMSPVAVTGYDAFDNVVTGATTALSLTFGTNAGGVGATLSGGGPVAPTNGVATFAAVTLNRVGVGYTLVASNGAVSITSSAFTVVPGPAASVAFVQQPTDSVAGSPLAQPVTVAFVDASGNVVTQKTSTLTVSLSQNPGGSTFGGTMTVAAVLGVATFADLTLDKVGVGYQLSATDGVMTPALSTGFAITPGAATALAIATQPPASSVAGNGIPVGVKVIDAHGNTVTSAAHAITLSGNPVGTTLGGTLTRTPVLGVADLSPTLTAAGTGYSLTATATPALTPVTTTPFAIVAGATAGAVVFVVQPSNAAAGVPLAPPVQVAIADPWGNPMGVGSQTVTLTLLATPDGGTLDGGAGGAGLALAAANGVATFSTLSIDKVGAGKRLGATGAGLALGATSQPFAITPGVPSSLAFTTGTANVTAGTCSSAVALGLADSMGNATTAGSALPVTLSASAPLTFYADAACTTALTQVTVAAGQGATSFYFQASAAGGVTLTATSALGQATLVQNVVANNATQLAISTAVTAVAGACSPPITIQAQDALKNPAGVSARVTVSLGGGTGVSFFGDAACTTAISSVDLMPANAAPTVYFLGKSAQKFTLSATSTTLSAASQPNETIVAGPAVKLQFTDTASAQVAGACSPARTVVALDANLNQARPAGPVTVNLGSNAGGAFFSDAACTAAVSSMPLTPAAGAITFYERHTLVGQPVVTATDASFALTAATETLVIGAGPASQLVFVTQPAASIAGAPLAGPPQVAIEDAFGNRVSSAATPIDLALAPTAGSVLLGGVTAVTTVAGLATFSGATVPTTGAGYVLKATSGALTPASSAPFAISAAAAARLVFGVQPSAVVAGVNIAPALTVALHDAFDNLVPVSTGTVALALDAARVDGGSSGAAVARGGLTAQLAQGVATFASVQVVQAAGGYQLRASATGVTDGLSAPFDVTPASPNQLLFAVQPSTTTANVAIAPPVQVAVGDLFGNVVPSGAYRVLLSLATNTTNATLTSTSQQSVAGLATFGDVTVDKTGKYRLAASSTPALVSAQSLEFDVAFGAPAKLVFRPAASAELVAGRCSPRLIVEVQDEGSNPSPVTVDTPVALTAPQSAGVTFYSDVNCTAEVTAASPLSLLTGATSLSFYFTASNGGDIELTATGTNLRPGSQVWKVTSTNAPLVLSPSNKQVAPGEHVAFQATGGQPPYAFTLSQNNSHGSIDAATGAYVAGPDVNVSDTVQVKDAAGRKIFATVTVALPDVVDAGPGPRERLPANGFPLTGCGCTSAEGGAPSLLALGLLALVAGRRRGRAAVAALAVTGLWAGVARAAPAAAQSVLIVAADDTARGVVEGLVERFGAAKVAVKTAGGRAPAMACLTEKDAARQRDCLVDAASGPGTLSGVLLVRATEAHKVREVTFEVLELATRGSVFKETAKGPAASFPKAAAPTVNKLLTALAQLKRFEPAKAEAALVREAPQPVVVAPRKEKPTIAVLDVEVTVANEKLDGAAFSEMLVNSVDETREFHVISSKDIVTMLGLERQKSLLGCTDNAACMTEFANALGTDLVMVASVGKVGDSYLVSAKIIDGQKSKVLGRSSVQSKTANLLLDALWKVTQGALDGYGSTLPPDDALRWAAHPRKAPPTAMVEAQGQAPSSFGLTAAGLLGFQPLSEKGHRASVGAEALLTWRSGRLDLGAGLVLGANLGARVALGWAVLEGPARVDVGVRGTAIPGWPAFGGGPAVTCEYAFTPLWAATATGAADFYPTGVKGDAVVVALLATVGVATHF